MLITHALLLIGQLKLQRQNMCLGPPPLLIPGKRIEDSGATSEDDGLPQSPPEILFHDRTAQGPSYKVNGADHIYCTHIDTIDLTCIYPG